MRTKLAHAAQMSLDPALVLDERLIARTMPVDPVAYCLSQRTVVSFSAIDLRRCHSEYRNRVRMQNLGQT